MTCADHLAGDGMAATGHPHRAEPPVPAAGDHRSSASLRLRALAALSGSLTDALSPGDAASLVEQKALSALGANSAVVITLGTFPPAIQPVGGPPPADPALQILHAIGLTKEVQHCLENLSLDAPVPLAEVARSGEPLYLHSEAELRRYPEWGEAMLGAGARSAAVVPVWANGELRGVLGLAWPDTRRFDEDERAFVLTLGVMCAQAIMRAHLRDAEETARIVAEDANRSKTQFLTMISHELRTPMNAVLGYTALMAEEADGPITPIQKEHLGRVRASGRHLLGLIEDLLGYARVEAGGDAVKLEYVDLLSIVEESLDLVRPLAAEKGIRVHREGATEPIEIQTDPRKLRQILVNLLGNAVKFTDAGDVVLVLRVEGLRAETKIVFEVTDSGPGISESDQRHVFDAYWQVQPSTSHAPGGTGLGLPVARQLARLLGGDVTIARSEMGRGSTFVVSLPARYPEANRAPAH